MKKPNDYDVTEALRRMATGHAKGESVSVHAVLRTCTDIPEERLDFASHECEQIFEGLKTLVDMLKIIIPADKLEEAICKSIASGSKWIDDDRRNLRVRAFAEGHENGEEPLVTVETKLKPKD